MRLNIPQLFKYDAQEGRHSQSLKTLLAMYDLSRREMEQRYPAWKRADEDYRAFLPESTEDKRRKLDRDKGILQYTTIMVPQTYAMLLTAHTYWSSIFLNRNPIFQLMTRHGAAEQTTQGMEALIDYQTFVGKMLVPLFIWLLDPGRYGFGVVRTYWKNEVKRVAQQLEVSTIDPESGLTIPDRTHIEKVTQEVPGYRGNKAYNVRPYNWFPDPRVPLVDFQQGEFCADTTYRSLSSLKANPRYFNLDALEQVRGRRTGTTREEDVGSDQIQLPAVQAILDLSDSDLSDRGSFHILEIVANILPDKWKLGEEDLPEKWLFTIGEKQVIIGAEPYGYLHDEFPYDLLMYEVEGYALDIRGMLEIGKDFNTAESWLVNSHMFNVRRALNDQLVVDPSRIVLKDLLDGGPGKIIRAKPAAYGTPMADAIHQLQIVDITRSHISDTQMLAEMAQQILGVNQNVMGTLDQGGRKTATEVRSANTFSISRLKTVAEWFSATGFAPLCQKLVQNTQQFYFQDGVPTEQTFRLVGDLGPDLSTIKVTPDSIAGFYDYAPVDGTLPIDRMAQAQLFKELLTAMISVPGMATGYNIDGMINWIARMVGVKNLKQFKVQVLPDQQMQQQVQAGNAVPMGGNGLGMAQ